jgi:hypothetical protein
MRNEEKLESDKDWWEIYHANSIEIAVSIYVYYLHCEINVNCWLITGVPPAKVLEFTWWSDQSPVQIPEFLATYTGQCSLTFKVACMK